MLRQTIEWFDRKGESIVIFLVCVRKTQGGLRGISSSSSVVQPVDV